MQQIEPRTADRHAAVDREARDAGEGDRTGCDGAQLGDDHDQGATADAFADPAQDAGNARKKRWDRA